MDDKRLFLPQLDGLRFLAFLAIFVHHAPKADFIWGWDFVHDYGWMGVELFFVISAYLFFHLMKAEHDKTGTVSITNFYLRRALRIVPLLWVYTLSMFLLSDHSLMALVRSGGIMVGIDNVLAWIAGYSTVPNTTHLWTLSFEMQVYLVIPLAFLAYQRLGPPAFLRIMALIWLYCVVLRILVALAGAPHPVVWVTPVLRPEAVIVGFVLGVARPRWNPFLSLFGATLAVVVLVFLPPLHSTIGMIVIYPFTAMAAGLLVDAVLRSNLLAAVLSAPPLQFLGRISFGLYVFHFLGMAIATYTLLWLGLPGIPTTSVLDWAPWVLGALLATIGLSTASYWIVERPFLKLKTQRFSSVDGRETSASI